MKNWILIALIGLSLFVSCNDDNKKDNNLVSLDAKEISAIAIDNDNIRWVGTSDGLFKSLDDQYQQVEGINGGVVSLTFESAQNTLWIGTSNGLLKATISNGQITVSVIDADKLANKVVNATYIDATRYWFATNAGPTLNKGTNWKKENFLLDVFGEPTTFDIEGTRVNSISAWDGDYYFATSGRSIYRAYGFNDTLDAFTGATQLAAPYNGDALTDTMNVVFVDSKGIIWMGGNNGLQSHTGHDTKQNNITYAEITGRLITAIAEDKAQNIWVGTDKGVFIYNGNSWTNKYENKFITAIAISPNGEIWIGTKAGLFKD